MSRRRDTRESCRWYVIIPVLLIAACGDRTGDSGGEPTGQVPVASSQSNAVEFSGLPQVTPQQIDDRFRAVETAEKDIARETFDPDALVTSVGKDPVTLFNWVRDNTYWVPYRGALRGPRGVLMDRVGNTLDRSLLLAELLRTAGHEVRLAHGRIADERARQLLGQLRPVSPNILKLPDPTTPDALKEEIRRKAAGLQLDADQIFRQLMDARASYERHRDEMKGRLTLQSPLLVAAVGALQGGDDRIRTAIDAVGDHWWVQRKDRGNWIDLDPLLADARPGASLTPPTESFPYDRPSGEIPLDSRFAQELTIRVIVEQWKGGRLTESVALDHSFRPAEKFGETLIFQNIPLHWSIGAAVLRESNPLEAIGDSVLTQTEWLPLLAVGSDGIFQSSVKDSGDLNHDPRASGPNEAAGGVADTLAGSDSFGGSDDAAQAEAYFTAEWIEYEIRVPGESPRKIRREVFDMLPAETRMTHANTEPSPNHVRRLNRALNLMGSIQILPLVSRLSPEFVASRTIHEVLNNREAVTGVHAGLGKGSVDEVLDEVKKWKPTSERLYELALTRFEWSAANRDVYLGAPNILSFRRTLTANARGELGTIQGYDIVANDVAVHAAATMSPFSAQVTQGAADTNAEGLLLGDSVANAGSAMDASPQSGSWVTIRKPDDLSSLDVKWPADARARMIDSLQAGHVVVAPRSLNASSAPDSWTWWQIDPRSGQTLGFGQQGWGQAKVEKSITVAAIVWDAVAVGVITGHCTFLFCIAKNYLLDRFPDSGLSGKNVDIVAGCACSAFDAGAKFAAARVAWLGGPKGVAVAISVLGAIKVVGCS